MKLNGLPNLNHANLGRWSSCILLPILLGGLSLCLLRQQAFAMATEQIGPDKPDRPTTEQSGWYKGIVELPRHSSRVYSVWVNGNENFYFQSSPDEINELISLFSKARLRDHEIQLEPGTNTVKSFGGNVFDYNVSLQILDGIALAMNREKDTAATHEPRLTVYVGEDSALLKQLKLPANIHLHSEVAGADFPGHLPAPSRKPWYGRIQFDDGRPAVDFGSGLQTAITLWDGDSSDGIPMGSLTSDGILRGALSDSELASLRAGKSWLTVTVGNFTAEPKRTDPKFPPELLAQDQEQTKPFKISRPSNFYYGRILFEDGSPAVLTNAPWPGAEITVSLPYVGTKALDAEGYFKAFFTPEQVAQFRTQKPFKNIYVPVDEHSGRATDAFPLELLSLDKAKAGVVKIAKPVLTPRYDPASAPSLLGKPLPALADLQLDPPAGSLANHPVLVCFFDLQERPSRNAISELLRQTKDLKAQGIDAILIQSSAVDRAALRSFAATNQLSFPIGMIRADEAKTQFNWGIRARPWMILADKDHVIRAEGFGVAELAEKLKSIR